MRGRMGNEFLAFSEYDGFSVIENQKQSVSSAINSQPDDYILNVNKEEYIAHIVSEFTITPLEIHEDQLTASTYEAQIPAERHPSDYYVHSGKSYPKDVIKYHLPFTGDPQLLKVRASSYTLSSPRITIEDCLEKVENRYELVHLTTKRVKQLRDGAEPLIRSKNKAVVTALREIAAGKVKHAPVNEYDSDEF